MAMNMTDMVKALVELPDDQRATMMGQRLKMFAEMEATEREAAMGQMMQALMTLPPQDVRKLVKSRLEALCELPGDSRMALMQSQMSLLRSMPPERAAMDRELMEQVMPELKPEYREQMMKMMSSMQAPAAAHNRAGAGTATAGKNAEDTSRAAKKKPWWRF